MRKKLRRLLSTLLAACMLVTVTPVTLAASTTDLEGHWAQAAMEEFIEKGWLSGYGNGNYGPDDSMTRAQFAVLINQVAGLTQESDTIANYTDVESGAWYYSDLAKALAAGYMSGTSDTTMSPNATITRQEALTMLASLLGLTATEEAVEALSQFPDASAIAEYAKNPVAAMVAAGYVGGSDDGQILPQTELTRAQGITILKNASTALQATQPDQPAQSVVATGNLKDGVYTGTGAGYGGTMTLQMTVAGGKITALEILSNNETTRYLNQAKTILDKVIANQGTDGVDTVSGATRSSNGILTAIKACISQAQGGADTSVTGRRHGVAAGQSTPTVGETFTGLKDGVYEGSATGYSGTTKVKVTVSGGKITDVEIVSHGDTDSYFNSAKSVLDQVVKSQSTDVDTVSGATWSSYGILNAINNALEEAKGSTDSVQTYSVATWNEFTQALAKAQDGDTIQLTADITDAGEDYTALTKEDGSSYDSLVDAVSSATLGMATINKAITIDGTKASRAAGDHYTISAGENQAFCLNISGSGVVIQNLTIDGASYGVKMGGGIYLAGGHNSTGTPSLTMTNVTVKNCASYKSTMPGNGGGAIYAKGNVTLTATDCTFENNAVKNTGFGGAVYAQSATVVLDNCTFTGNSAPTGGAVAASGTANLTVTNSTFTGNKSDNGGNDIYIFDGKTPTKPNQFSNSAVSFALSDNTYQDDSTATELKDYSVVLGRFYEDGYAGNGSDVVLLDGHDVTFTSVDRTEVDSEAAAYVTLWMNIPYDEFYSADISNEVEVDAVSSATKSKTRTGTLAGGSYHVDSEGTDITGITFPVVITQDDFEKFKLGQTEITDSSTVTIEVTNRAQTSSTEYKGKDALFESASYSYYVVTNETNTKFPTYYKVASYENGTLTFGKTQGVATTLSNVTASLQTETNYGDYQLNLIGVDAFSNSTDAINGIVIHTEEGHDYGLRHLENIWLGTQLAWCTGFTTSVHNCPTSSAHYEKMMGETITGVTYYTSKGIFEIELDDIYVPVKFTNTFTVEDAAVSGKTSTVTMEKFPDTYTQSFAVTNAGGTDVTNTYGFNVSEGKLTWNNSAKQGAYTLTVSDSENKYASYSAAFTLTTDAVVAQYDDTTLSLKAASGVSAEDFSNYLSCITSVSVDGKSYAASGRGAVKIIDEDGFIDLNAKSGQDYVFSDLTQDKTYNVTVTATGYSNDLTFTVTIPESGLVFGTATLTYAQFYAGDVSSTDSYGVDGVSSATVSKYSIMSNMYTDFTEDKTDGYHILGVQNVNVAVSWADYRAYVALNPTFKVSHTEPGQYKLVTVENGVATYSATEFNTQDTITDAVATLKTGSTWGDYEIDITETNTKYLRNDRTDDWAINSAIQGIILETDDGLKVGMEYLQSIWVQPYEVSFNVSANSAQNAHIAGWDNLAELSKLVGKTITSVTYIMQNGAYVYKFADGIYVKPAYTGDATIKAQFTDGSNVVTLTDIPDALEDVTVTITCGSGRQSVTVADKVEVGNGTVTMTENYDSTQTYTIKVSSSNFADITAAA